VGGDTPDILQPPEAAFEEVAFLAGVLVVLDRLLAVRPCFLPL
jgi:hypothetical protein